jgi:hypothetical protein
VEFILRVSILKPDIQSRGFKQGSAQHKTAQHYWSLDDREVLESEMIIFENIKP